MAKTFFQGCQNCNKCPEEQINWKPFGMQKKCNFFQILNGSFSLFSAKKFSRVSKTAIYVSLGKFEDIVFEGLDNISNFFGLWAKYKRPLVENLFSGLSQSLSARPDNFFEENQFIFHRKFIFPFIFGIWVISLSFSNKFSEVCQKCSVRGQMKKVKRIEFW